MASSNAELDISANGPVVDRRERLQNTIDSLIKLRQDVIVSYCKLSGVSSFDKRDIESYDAFEGSKEDIEMLSNDLSRLGQIIAIRGELEDQILDALSQKK